MAIVGVVRVVVGSVYAIDRGGMFTFFIAGKWSVSETTAETSTS